MCNASNQARKLSSFVVFRWEKSKKREIEDFEDWESCIPVV